jgi:N-terminal domain of anti-restriction factor ArdC
MREFSSRASAILDEMVPPIFNVGVHDAKGFSACCRTQCLTVRSISASQIQLGGGNPMKDRPHRDAMQEVAHRVVAGLERGVKPWVRPWSPDKGGGPQAPFNPVTDKRYHGIDVLVLGTNVHAFRSGDPR